MPLNPEFGNFEKRSAGAFRLANSGSMPHEGWFFGLFFGFDLGSFGLESQFVFSILNGIQRPIDEASKGSAWVSCLTASRVSWSVASSMFRGTRSASGLSSERNATGMPRLMAIISTSAYTPPSRSSSRVTENVRKGRVTLSRSCVCSRSLDFNTTLRLRFSRTW